EIDPVDLIETTAAFINTNSAASEHQSRDLRAYFNKIGVQTKGGIAFIERELDTNDAFVQNEDGMMYSKLAGNQESYKVYSYIIGLPLSRQKTIHRIHLT